MLGRKRWKLFYWMNLLEDCEGLNTKNCHPLSKIVIHTSAQNGCAEVWMTILESGWNLWVWLVGVVSMRWVWLVGGIYGYGYNV